MGFNYEDGKIVKYENNFLDSHYGAHYLTAYEIFKDNISFGSGPKTFRIIMQMINIQIYHLKI